MQNRTEDVRRKTLLLLYLATESFDDSAEDEEARARMEEVLAVLFKENEEDEEPE